MCLQTLNVLCIRIQARLVAACDLAVRYVYIMLLLSILAAVVSSITATAATPTSANCSKYYYEQTIDHFNWATPSPGTLDHQDQHFNPIRKINL